MINIIVKKHEGEHPVGYGDCWEAKLLGAKETIYTQGYGKTIEAAIGSLVRRSAKNLGIKIKVVK